MTGRTTKLKKSTNSSPSIHGYKNSSTDSITMKFTLSTENEHTKIKKQ